VIYPVDENSLAAAAEIIKGGGIVAFPTETVYGLGGDAFNRQALAKIFAAKERPFFDPLIIHIAAQAALERITDLSRMESENIRRLEKLTAELWPGPLTLILPKRSEVPDLATSGLATAAVRFPSDKTAQTLILLSTGAVAAPSANLFGRLSPTRAEHVEEQLGGRVDLILDGGRSSIGVESTVLDLSSRLPRILRPGGTSKEKIETLIGPVLDSSGKKTSPMSPGQAGHHYAPGTPLSVYHRDGMIRLPYKKDEAFLFFDASSRTRWHVPAGRLLFVKTLSETGDTIEAAANLFDMLHSLDKPEISRINAELAPGRDLGPALNDRLKKAAARLY
jgi:L-threonylcarbamoyladenylate synthase